MVAAASAFLTTISITDFTITSITDFMTMISTVAASTVAAFMAVVSMAAAVVSMAAAAVSMAAAAAMAAGAMAAEVKGHGLTSGPTSRGSRESAG
jgi:hypothetical protein